MCLKWQWGRRIDTAQALLSQRQIAVDAFIRQISSASTSTTSQDDDDEDDDSNKEQNFSDQRTVLSRCTLAIAVAIQVPFPFLELESDSKKS